MNNLDLVTRITLSRVVDNKYVDLLKMDGNALGPITWVAHPITPDHVLIGDPRDKSSRLANFVYIPNHRIPTDDRGNLIVGLYSPYPTKCDIEGCLLGAARAIIDRFRVSRQDIDRLRDAVRTFDGGAVV